jgi:dihydroorotase
VTVFDPSKEWMVDSKQFVSKGKNTPFDGQVFKGKVILTTFNGHITYKEESIRI